MGGCEVIEVKSSTFQMSKEGVNSSLKRYRVVRVKGDWRPQVLRICSSTDAAKAFSCGRASALSGIKSNLLNHKTYNRTG